MQIEKPQFPVWHILLAVVVVIVAFMVAAPLFNLSNLFASIAAVVLLVGSLFYIGWSLVMTVRNLLTARDEYDNQDEQ